MVALPQLLLLIMMVHGMAIVQQVQLLQLLYAVVLRLRAQATDWRRHLVVHTLAAADQLPGMAGGHLKFTHAISRLLVVGQNRRGIGGTRGLLAGERGLGIELLHGH